MNIILIDDQIDWLINAKRLLVGENIRRDKDYCYHTFTNQADAKLFLKTNDVDLIISDIEVDEMNNIVNVKKLAKQYGCCIVFLTNHSHYAMQSFGLNVHDYILKEDFHKRVDSIFSLLQEIEDNRSTIDLDLEFGNISLSINRIYAVEALGHQLTLYTYDKTYQIKKQTIEKLLQLLPDYFVQISRHAIINAKNIKTIKNLDVVLNNNKIFQISKRRKKDVYNTYCSIIGG